MQDRMKGRISLTIFYGQLLCNMIHTTDVESIQSCSKFTSCFQMQWLIWLKEAFASGLYQETESKGKTTSNFINVFTVRLLFNAFLLLHQTPGDQKYTHSLNISFLAIFASEQDFKYCSREKRGCVKLQSTKSSFQYLMPSLHLVFHLLE